MVKEQTFFQFLERLWQLCVFQSSPLELKVSPTAISVVSPTYFLMVAVTMLLAPGLHPSFAVGAGLLFGTFALITLFLWILHFYKGAHEHFMGSMLATTGTQCIILFINIPALLFYNQIPFGNYAAQMVLGLMVILLGWSLAITGRILHLSLKISLALGAAIALSFVFIVRAGGALVLQ
ncbi:MAG: hypothetical protein KUG83_10700 [Gammaproteobacteria bacterium]|nr:hypothetical protein [Gammaproteobacteria bacterium]